MTETAVKKQRRRGKKNVGRNRLPVKNTINLAVAGQEKIAVGKAIPGIVLILAAAVLLAKFGVADRFAAMSRASYEVSQMQNKLDETYAALNAFTGLDEEYAHYTTSGMTEQELSLADRPAVIELIERVILPVSPSNSWTLSGNTLSLTVEGESLQQINLLARQIEKEPLVAYCSVNTANMDEITRVVEVPAGSPVTMETDGSEDNESFEEYLESVAEEVAYSETEDVTEPQTELVEVTNWVRANIVVYLENPPQTDAEVDAEVNAE